MELLLNVAWLAIAAVTFIAFVCRHKGSAWYARVPYQTALLALACALALLFPVVSASDDLHPTQAVLEDATKRIQQVVAPQHHGNSWSSQPFIPALLALYLLAAPVFLFAWRPPLSQARVVSLARKPLAGRSPPSL